MSSVSSPALTKLSAAQQELVSAAAGRPDGAVILPARLKGHAANKVVEALLGKGLVREIRAKGDLPVWRADTETGRRYSLVLTRAGRAFTVAAASTAAALPVAMPGNGGTRPAGLDVNDATKASLPTAGDVVDVRSATRPRSGSKLAEVMALLQRHEGASVAQLMDVTGWLPHTTRAALTGLRKRGYTVVREAAEGGSVYRIPASASLAAAA